MKKSNVMLLSLFILGCVACMQNQKNKSIKNDDYTNKTNTAIMLSQKSKCFMAAVGKDSAFLSLKKDGNSISGDLIYQFAEKDNSKGSVVGTIDLDTLKLNYTFQSEGTTSTRAIKLLLLNKEIYEVYGNQKAEAGKGFIFKASGCKN